MAQDYIIACSSTASLTPAYLESNNIPLIQYTYFLDDQEYVDDCGKSISYSDFYNHLRNGSIARTSMVNPQKYEDFFRPFLEAGKHVIYIELSSGITGTVANARAVAEQLNAQYEAQVCVIDSLCACRGYGLLVHYALKKQREGLSFQQTIDWIEANKRKIIHWFTVDDLDFLRRGGRVSGISAFLGTMLKIKPVLNVSGQGKLIPLFKCRGRKKAIASMVDHMREDIDQPDGQTVFICQGDCPEDAAYLEQLVRAAFPSITDIQIGYTGTVIGAHSGPGTLALFYLGKERYEKADRE